MKGLFVSSVLVITLTHATFGSDFAHAEGDSSHTFEDGSYACPRFEGKWVGECLEQNSGDGDVSYKESVEVFQRDCGSVRIVYDQNEVEDFAVGDFHRSGNDQDGGFTVGGTVRWNEWTGELQRVSVSIQSLKSDYRISKGDRLESISLRGSRLQLLDESVLETIDEKSVVKQQTVTRCDFRRE